jgi:hypothetical protein
MNREPKRFRRACRRRQGTKADYILRAWEARYYAWIAKQRIYYGQFY